MKPYNGNTVWVKKNPPWRLVAIFPKRLGIFQPSFTCLLRVPVYARLPTFIQLSATLTKLCYIKREHPVHIMCAKCPPSAESHAGVFWHFSQTVRNFSSNFTRLLNVHIYARVQIFSQLSPTVTKLWHIKATTQRAFRSIVDIFSTYSGRAYYGITSSKLQVI